MNTLEKEILESFKGKVTARYPGTRLILFGSRARGDADPDSDMDVLVLLDHSPTPEDRQTISEFAWEACFGKGIVLSPVPVSQQDWEQGILSASLLAVAVGEDGIPV